MCSSGKEPKDWAKLSLLRTKGTSPSWGYREPWERESMSMQKPHRIISLFDFLYFYSKRGVYLLQFSLF